MEKGRQGDWLSSLNISSKNEIFPILKAIMQRDSFSNCDKKKKMSEEAGCLKTEAFGEGGHEALGTNLLHAPVVQTGPGKQAMLQLHRVGQRSEMKGQ